MVWSSCFFQRKIFAWGYKVSGCAYNQIITCSTWQWASVPTYWCMPQYSSRGAHSLRGACAKKRDNTAWPVLYNISPVFCNISPVFYNISPVFCNISPVFCNISPVFCTICRVGPALHGSNGAYSMKCVLLLMSIKPLQLITSYYWPISV